MKKMLVLVGILTTMLVGTQSFAACHYGCSAYPSQRIQPCCPMARPCSPACPIAKPCCDPCCPTVKPCCPACPVKPCCDPCCPVVKPCPCPAAPCYNDCCD